MDYASILRGGQQLVPNLREQLVQDAVMKMQQQQFDAQQQAVQREIAEQARMRAEQERFEADRDRALLSGDPNALIQLRLRYPEFTKGMKDAFDALDKTEQRRNLTQLGTIYARGQAGDVQGAAAALRERIEADREAGVPDPADQAILDALESGDPVQQRAAMGQVGILLAAIEPDKFADVYGKLNPTEATPATIREYDARVAKFGRAAADAWLATQDTKLIPVQAGGTVYALGGGAGPNETQATPDQEGGDPSGSGARGPALGAQIENTAQSVIPGIRVTSRKRTPERNRQVGGTANSFHLTDEARDFVPPPGMSMGQMHSQLKQAYGAGFDVINEGDHVHVEPASRATGPVKVRTVQEARKLPPGTQFITPDGRTMRVPAR